MFVRTNALLIIIRAFCCVALAACSASPMKAAVTTYAPSSGPTPSIPLALASGTVWYGDSNYTSIVPFNTSRNAFGKPIPDPTAIPYSSSTVVEDTTPEVLKGVPLAPRSLAGDANGNLWGVGTAEKRLGFTQYASSSAIVEYDRAGSARAFPVPDRYMPGYFTVEGPDGRPWSMIWKHETTAAVVQLNANGSITPKFTVALNALPAHYSVQYARFGANGIVWLLGNGFPHPRITRWTLGSQNPTQISLPVRGYLRCEALTTSRDGSAWIIGQEINGAERGQTYFYRVSPAGLIARFAVPALNSRKTCPATIFAANGSVWGVVTVDYGPNVGDAYLLRVDPSGTVTSTAIAGARGSIAEVGSSIAGPGDSAFLSSFSGALPELRYTH